MIGPQHAPLIDALRITQDNMLALSRLQEQTARLHQQFLEGQAASQHQLHTLIQQQQNLLSVSVGVASVGVPVLPAAPIVAAPALPAPAPIAPLAPIASSPPIPTPVPLPAPVPAPVVQERAPLNGSAPAPIPAVTARSTGNQDIGTVLLEIVAEKTGYPQDILELDMELDADLGIDSIKRVEILSAMQERLPNAPTVQPDQLGRLRTLREITEYLGDGDSAPAAAQKSAEEEPQAVPQAGDPVAQPRLEAFELTAKLEATGPRVAVGVKPGTAFWITDDDSKLAPALATALGARGIEAKVVGPRRPGAVPTELGGLVILAPAAGMDDAALKSAWRMAKRAGPALGRAAKNSANKTAAIFATVSRLDGGFGLLGGQLADPLSGGLAGLAKSASHEWPAVQCRALDRAPDWLDIDEVANALADELLATGPAEVGVSPDGRRVLELRSRTFEADSSSRPLRENDLVVVTGGARGVTAGACLALARACKPRLLILGRSEVPSEEPEWSRGLADAAAIQKAVLQRADTKLTPRELKAAVQRCLANREIRDNLRALRDAGAQVTYRATDVRDAAAVREAIASETGPVRGVIHGAGVLADQLILDKTAESFDRVFDTKVGGLRHVLAALDPQELRALILFSSSTARFGRKGQVDYAMANEVLNKMALAAAARYPDCRVLSLNWGPWAGGMVDASLRGVFQKEGVSLIPLEAGADYLVRELTSAHVAVETVVLGPRSRAPTAPPSELPLVVEHEIDIEKHAFLKSHVIDGRAVLPMAMTQEWLAHAAAHANPGLPFLGVDGLQVLRGVVLSGKSLRLRIHADKARKEGELYRVRVELRGDHDTLHARAEVLLGREDAPAPATDPAELTEFDETRSLYGDLLFHGPHFQSVETVDGWSKEGLTATVKTAPQPNEWMDAPLRRRFFTDPLAVDAAFQLAILWTRRFLGSPSLPTKIGAYRQFGVFKKATVRVVGWVRESTESMLRADFEFRAEDGTVIARLLDYACAIDGALENAFARNRLPAKPAQP